MLHVCVQRIKEEYKHMTLKDEITSKKKKRTRDIDRKSNHNLKRKCVYIHSGTALN